MSRSQDLEIDDTEIGCLGVSTFAFTMFAITWFLMLVAQFPDPIEWVIYILGGICLLTGTYYTMQAFRRIIWKMPFGPTKH